MTEDKDKEVTGNDNTIIKKLAIIKFIKFNYKDRNRLTFYCSSDYEDGWSQNPLAIILDNYDRELSKSVGTAEGINLVIDLLKFFNVDDLSEVKDYICYVVGTGEFNMFKPLGLENLYINPHNSELAKVMYNDYFKE